MWIAHLRHVRRGIAPWLLGSLAAGLALVGCGSPDQDSVRDLALGDEIGSEDIGEGSELPADGAPFDGADHEADPEIGKAEEAAVAKGYLAVWQPGTGAQYWRTGMASGTFHQHTTDMFRNGFRVRSIDVYSFRESCGLLCWRTAYSYSAVYEPGSGAQWVHTGMTNQQFADRVRQYQAQGLHVVALAVSTAKRISAVFRPGSGGAPSWAGVTGQQAADWTRTWWNDGYQPNQLAGSDGKYTFVWGEKRVPGAWWSTGMSGSTFASRDQSYFLSGYRLASLDLSGDKYAAIWHYRGPASGAQYWHSGLTPSDLQRLSQQYHNQGLRLTVLRARKYDYPDESTPLPPASGGTAYTCPSNPVWVQLVNGHCYNLDGSISDYVYPGEIQSGYQCGRTDQEATARAAAVLSAVLGYRCLTDSETRQPGCCEYLRL